MDNIENISTFKIVSYKLRTNKVNSPINRSNKSKHAYLLKSNYSIKSELIFEYKDDINSAFKLYKDNDDDWKGIIKSIISDESILKWNENLKTFSPQLKIGKSILEMNKFWILFHSYMITSQRDLYCINYFIEVALNSKKFNIDNKYSYDSELIVILKINYTESELLNFLLKIPYYNASLSKPLCDEDYQIFLDFYTNKKIILPDLEISKEQILKDKPTKRHVSQFNTDSPTKSKVNRLINDPYSRFKKLLAPRKFDSEVLSYDYDSSDDSYLLPTNDNPILTKYKDINIKNLFALNSNSNFPKEIKLYLSSLPDYVINSLSTAIDDIKLHNQVDSLSFSPQPVKKVNNPKKSNEIIKNTEFTIKNINKEEHNDQNEKIRSKSLTTISDESVTSNSINTKVKRRNLSFINNKITKNKPIKKKDKQKP